MANKNKDAEVKKTETKKDTELKKAETKKDKKPNKARARKNAIKQIRKKATMIDVEIQNISNATLIYRDYRGGLLFELEPSQTKVISLDDLTEVNSRCPGFFTRYDLIVIDVIDDDDEVGIQDVLMYLGVDDIYVGLKNVEEDYMDILLDEESYDEFERVINLNKDILRVVAGNMIRKVKDEEYDQRDKMKLMIDKMPFLKDVFLEAEEARYE